MLTDNNNGSRDGNPPEDDLNLDLPTRFDPSLRLSLASKRAMVRDAIAAVRDGDLRGGLITGGPGIGKSFLVNEFVGSNGDHILLTGLLSRPEAIAKFEEFPDRLFVFDDTCGCLSDQVFLQLLLPGLGPATGDGGVRLISYCVKGKSKRIEFTGRMLFIGNSAFRGAPKSVIDALESRLFHIPYEPTRDELEAQLYDLAEQGFKDLEAQESLNLLTFVLRECRKTERTPEIRLLFDKILPMFQRHRRGSTDCCWREHVVQIVRQPHRAAQRPFSDAELFSILTDIQRQARSIAEQVAEYHRLTGRSRAAFFRDRTRLLGGTEKAAG